MRLLYLLGSRANLGLEYKSSFKKSTSVIVSGFALRCWMTPGTVACSSFISAQMSSTAAIFIRLQVTDLSRNTYQL